MSPSSAAASSGATRTGISSSRPQANIRSPRRTTVLWGRRAKWGRMISCGGLPIRRVASRELSGPGSCEPAPAAAARTAACPIDNQPQVTFGQPAPAAEEIVPGTLDRHGASARWHAGRAQCAFRPTLRKPSPGVSRRHVQARLSFHGITLLKVSGVGSFPQIFAVAANSYIRILLS